MAIFGIGSLWEKEEQKVVFFEKEQIVLGWSKDDAKDLYSIIGAMKVGDIVYLKSNKPGSREINVKGIGIITKSFINCLIDGDYKQIDIIDYQSLFISVKWINKQEFKIQIPSEEGKLTNIRAATFYEEYLPYVQNEIIARIVK